MGCDAEELKRRIDELLYDGWQPAAVWRELSIPEQQERSLEVYAQKYRHRRILAPAARLREQMAAGAAGMSDKAMKLFTLVLAQGLSENVTEDQRQRAAQTVLDFMQHVERVAQRAEQSEKEEQSKDDGKPKENVEQMLERVARDVFGVVRNG